MKNIASHNSLSYIIPKNIWVIPFNWMAKCQKCDIEEQFIGGIRYFDFRVKFNKYGNPIFCHGLANYNRTNSIGNIFKYFDFLNHSIVRFTYNKQKCYCRILLEDRYFVKDRSFQYSCFKTFCSNIERKFTNLTFVGGRSCKYWDKFVYHFNNGDDDLHLIDKYSSVCETGIKKIMPKLYAKRHNVSNYFNLKKDETLFCDYVDILID